MKDNYNQSIIRKQIDLLGRPKIIVNADDFGYCKERSQGILDLIKEQRISSLSVMVNAPNIQQQSCKLINQSPINAYQRSDLSNENNSIQKLRMQKVYFNKKTNPCVSVGLHLNLTQFEPCSFIKNYKNLSIIDSLGKFKGKKYIYDNLQQLFLENDVKIFIEVEIRAQIQKFIKIFKTKPSHIDGHNHVHIIPEIAQIVCKVSRLFGIYRVRMPIPFQLNQIKNENNVNNMNKIFKSLAQQSKKVYDKYGFLYPDYMLGLDTLGKHLTSNQIKAHIQQIMSKHSENLSNKFIEIMVHPGYMQKNQFKNYETCAFSKSQQRQLQLLTLKSQQFSKIVNPLYSYFDITKRVSQKSVLIYSKLTNCTGNLTTSLRLAKILEQNLGFRAYLIDVPDLQQGQDNQQDRMRDFIQKFSIKLIIGVNLTRSAQIIHKATHKIKNNGLGYKIPYILMIAGTDANITLNQNQNQLNLTAIDESIKSCECLISLSQDMKEKVQKYLQMKKISKQIVLINQSTISETAFIQKQITIIDTSNNCSEFKQSIQKPYIVFPTSFRKVKAVHHILSELNALIAKYDLNVYVLGPIISEQYYNRTINKFLSVSYLGCIPHSKYIKLMENALFLINCSESQGMSCSILEGLASKVPIIARKNQGNCQLIEDGVNGFIYEDGQQFLQKAGKLIQNYEQIKKEICQKGYQLIINKFSYEKQIQKYIKIIQQYYKTKSYTLQLKQIQNKQDNEVQAIKISMQLLFLNNVHGVSPTNLKIFDKFFQQNNNLSAFQSFITPILEDHLNNSDFNSIRLSILDIGCGSGIFALYFITKLVLQYQSLIKKSSSKFYRQDCLIKLSLVLSDIQKQSLQSTRINLRTLQQMLNTKGNKNIIIQSIILIQSSMFEEIQKELPDYKFDIILANMPQTMFKNAQSRIDKNGGPDGFKHTQILLKNYSKFIKSKSTSLLITLFSYMLEQKKYHQLLQLNHSKIQWRSQTETHKIESQDYDKMQVGLASVIQQQMKKGKANISKKGDIFYVPAQLRVIMQK